MNETVIIKNNCCCSEMWDAIKEKREIPINVENTHSKLFYALEFIDTGAANCMKFDDEIGDQMIDYCPFCGKNVSKFKLEKSGRWKERKALCGGFLAWYDEVHVKASTRMFEYDHRNNQFYMHKRRGFDKGYVPITYCIYCGEPLSEMIEKYGVPEEVQSCLHDDEWWKKRGL